MLINTFNIFGFNALVLLSFLTILSIRFAYQLSCHTFGDLYLKDNLSISLCREQNYVVEYDHLLVAINFVSYMVLSNNKSSGKDFSNLSNHLIELLQKILQISEAVYKQSFR